MVRGVVGVPQVQGASWGAAPWTASPSTPTPTPPLTWKDHPAVLSKLLAAPFRSELLTVLFWREVLSRVVRQGIQTLVPVLGAATLTGLQGINYGSMGLVLLGSEAVVVLRAVFEVRASADAGLPEQLFDRAAAAAAGSLLGVVLANQADVLHVSWLSALGVAGGAALASAVHLFADALALPLGDGSDPSSAAAAPTPVTGVAGDAVPVDTTDYGDDGDLI